MTILGLSQLTIEGMRRGVIKNAVFHSARVRCAHHTPPLSPKRCAQRTLPITSLRLKRTFNRTLCEDLRGFKNLAG